jgi:hypothetical protein
MLTSFFRLVLVSLLHVTQLTNFVWQSMYNGIKEVNCKCSGICEFKMLTR